MQIKYFVIVTSIVIFSSTILSDDKKLNPEDTEIWKPEPSIVIPAEDSMPPSDAIILFDGSNLSQWQHKNGDDASWSIENGAFTVVDGSGDLQTKVSFTDIQLHLEWKTPIKISGEGQNRGNSGVFFQKRYEFQVLDSYNNRTYSNGQAASIYKQHIPLVNASKKPGEWQSYDVIFEAPVFNSDKTLQQPAFITVFHNGVLVHNHVKLDGPTLYSGVPQYTAHPKKQPLLLQDHQEPVSYRNIWIRNLPVD